MRLKKSLQIGSFERLLANEPIWFPTHSEWFSPRNFWQSVISI
jgi:hypothetical protein